MSALIRRIGLSSVLLLVIVGSAEAQEAQPFKRGGLWGSFGFGYGSLGGSPTPEGSFRSYDGSWGGLSGSAKIGFTASPSLRFALGMNGWVGSVGDWDNGGLDIDSNGLLSAQALFYPGAKDFFLLAGAGYANHAVGVGTWTGFGWIAGLGYDLTLNRSGSLALTPYFNWWSSTIESNPYVLDFGLALTFN